MADFSYAGLTQRENPLGIQSLILNRWSPRALLDQPVPEQDLLALLDAARWAPSCFNEQPWRFIVARQPQHLEAMRKCLAESNRLWAGRAPLLMAVLSKPMFAADGRPNRWNAFDAGAAWGYLALEAKARGLVAHAMGGFSVAKVRETFSVPADWGVHAVVAIGYQGPRELLPQDLQEREQPTPRQDLNRLWSEGRFDF